MKAKGTYLVPTLMAFEGIRERLGKGIYTRTVEDKVRMTLGDVGNAVTRAKALAVPIAFGTDSGVFEHGRNGQEFALLVQYGLTRSEEPTSGLQSLMRTTSSVFCLKTTTKYTKYR